MIAEIIEFRDLKKFSPLNNKLKRVVKIRNQLAHGIDLVSKEVKHHGKEEEFVQISFTNKKGKTVTETYNFVAVINNELMPTIKKIFELRDHLKKIHNIQPLKVPDE